MGIILVVFGHSFHEYPDNHGFNLLVYRMLYSFRMPLFIFTSGFLMLYTCRIIPKHKMPFYKFSYQKFLRLLLPFVFLTLITFIPRAMMSDFADDNINLTIGSFVGSFLYRDQLIIPFFWFLHTSFILLVIAYAFLIICESLNIRDSFMYICLISISVILLFIPNTSTLLSLGKTAELAVYFVLGMIFCRYSTFLDHYIPWTSWTFGILIFILWALSFIYTENTPFIAICSIFGIIMCISITKILETKNITLLDKFIGANYIIFLLSWYCNIFSQQVLHHFTDFPWWIYSILSFISGIYIPWLVYKYLQNHKNKKWVKITAFLLGQKLK